MVVSDAFARVLRARRGELNARFEEARRQYPMLDAGAFAAFLGAVADPVVGAAAAAHPDRAAEVGGAAYDAALDVVAHKIGGPGARCALVDDVWRRVLPAAAPVVAAEPARVIAALTNAAHHIASTPGVRGTAWVATMERLAGRTTDADTLLAAGQVAAWRAGMAQYRSGALAAADALPEPLALAAVGAPAGAVWADVRSRLAASPWYDPADPDAGGELPRLAAVAGAFRGYGGAFVEPPRVGMAGADFRVRGGAEEWLLCADAFGATLHRVPAGEDPADPWSPAVPDGLRVRDGQILWQGRPAADATWGDVTSAAANATTLAVTASLAHGVLLVALA